VISLELPAESAPQVAPPVACKNHAALATGPNQTLLPINDPDDVFVGTSIEV
jgi:hypothetical protein